MYFALFFCMFTFMVTKANFAVFFSVDRHKRAAWKKVREAGM